MRRPLLSVTATVLMALSAPSILAAQDVSAKPPSVLDTLSAGLVELELQRVSLISVANPQATAARGIDAQIATVHDRLRALPEGAAADRQATERLLLALEARTYRVEANMYSLQRSFIDEYPPIRQLKSELGVLQGRLSEIRSGKAKERNTG
jgi:hypothetical protein